MKQPIRISIFILIIIIFSSIIFITPYISLKISFSDERVHQILIAYIKSTINKSSVISSAHIDLFPTPSFVIENLRADPDIKGALSAGEIVIKPSIHNLLLFRLKIKEIVIKKAQIKITYDESGNMIIVGVSRKEKSSILPEKVKIKLENSNFEIDGIIRGNITLEDINGDIEMKKNGTNYLITSGMKWNLLSYSPSDNKESPIIPFKGGLIINAVYNRKGRNIELSKSSFIIGNSSIEIDGSGTKKESGWMVSIKHKIEDGDIQDFINILSPKRFAVFNKTTLTGKIDALIKTNFSLEKEGGLNNFTIDGSLSLTDGAIKTLSISGHKGSINKLSFKAEISDKVIKISDIKGLSDNRFLTGSGDVIFTEEPTYRLNLDGQIDLGLVSSLMKAPKEWQCEGTGDANVLIEGDLFGDVLPSIEGRLDNITGSFTLPSINERITINSASLILKRREAELILASGTLGGAKIDASGKLRGFIEPTIDFALDIEALDLDKIMRVGVPQTHLKCGYKFTLKGSIDIGRFKAKGFTCEDLSMNVLFSKNTIKISDMSMRAYNGTIGGRIEIVVPEGNYSVSLNGKGVDIGTYLANTTEYKDVITGGASDFSVSFSGKGTTKGEVKQYISGSGSIKSSGIKAENLTVLDSVSEWSGLVFLRSVEVRKLDGNFTIGDGKIKVNRCEIEGTSIDMVRLYGTVAFTGDIEMVCQLRLTKECTEKYKGRTIALFPDGEGKGNIAFICYGTTKKPKFRLDYDQMRKLAEGSIPPLTDEVLERYRIY